MEWIVSVYRETLPISVRARIFFRRNGFASGMSAAFRMPLRAFASPATAIRQTSRASIAGSSLYTGPIRSSSVLKSSVAQSWSRSSAKIPSQPTSLSRCFSTRTSPLRSADKLTGHDGVKAKAPPSQTKRIALLIVLGLAGIGAVFYSEELQHGYGAARRSGRVVGTLAVCINEWVKFWYGESVIICA